ncbi:204_t:CDS:1, partial [Entrophospora sp. SA101]
KQYFKPIKYLDFSKDVINYLPYGIKIVHITKEFGEASISELGRTVTGLAESQAKIDGLEVSVIMPYYKFLKSIYKPIRKYAKLSIDIQNDKNERKSVNFWVYKYVWKFDKNDDYIFEDPKEDFNVTSKLTAMFKKFKLDDDEEEKVVQDSSINSVTIYLIGPANNLEPFDRAFRLKSLQQLYNRNNKLPVDLVDLYFSKAAAELITFINTSVETPLFSPIEDKGVDIVHIHGSKNALAIKFMQDFHKVGNYRRPPPSIVYTIHDYIDEHLYFNELHNLKRFVNIEKFKLEHAKYFYDDNFFPSPYAIEKSEMVTFISESIAREMIEGKMDFDLKEIILPNIIEKASKGHWIGISNGVQYNGINPFNDIMLIETNSNFPQKIFDFKQEMLSSEPSVFELQDLVSTSKINAKNYLVREGLLDKTDLTRPVVLYIGKFQHNKGLEFMQSAAEHLNELDAKLIVIGYRDDFLVEELKEIYHKYPNNFVLIDDYEFQNDFGTLYRAAADIQFVPSLRENFGVIAAEGLLFGNPVVSTGVGNMKEFLINKTETPKIDSKNHYNSYIFELFKNDDDDTFDVEKSIDGMKRALTNAVLDWRDTSQNIKERELLVRGLIKDALKLDWNTDNGPLEKYIKVYRMAL